MLNPGFPRYAMPNMCQRPKVGKLIGRIATNVQSEPKTLHVILSVVALGFPLLCLHDPDILSSL